MATPSPKPTDNSRYNATRHGLTGARIVLPSESAEEYDQLRQSLIEEFDPASEEEAMLVERIAQNWWKLQRAERCEADFMSESSPSEVFSNRCFLAFLRYRTSIERAWNKARRDLADLQKARLKPPPVAAAVPIRKPKSVLSIFPTAPAAPAVTDSDGVPPSAPTILKT